MTANYITLTPGKYLVTGKATISTTRSGPVQVLCDLMGFQGGQVVSWWDQTELNLNKSVGIDTGSVYLTEVLNIGATTKVDLRCEVYSNPNETVAESSWMTATKVGNLVQA